MIPGPLPRRRVLWQVLAGGVVASASRLSSGLVGRAESQDKGGPEKAGPGKADGEAGKANGKDKGDKDAAKSKSPVLTVVVTGKGKPIPQAEVKVKVPGGEERVPTDQAGEASFRSPAAAGTAEVRVIVAGWESALVEVALTGVSQRLAIELKPLPETK